MDSRLRGNDREEGGNDREEGGNDREEGGNDYGGDRLGRIGDVKTGF